MTPEEFHQFYPLVADWLRYILTTYAGTARTVASCEFSRLPFYFKGETLASAKFIVVDRLPLPPLSSWGLTRFADFERGDPDGITYLDTFFLKPRQSRNEAIYFHELIHVIQWRILGPENFLRLYADGLERFGYRDSPLEAMAYDAEKQFVSSTDHFDAEQLVAEKTGRTRIKKATKVAARRRAPGRLGPAHYGRRSGGRTKWHGTGCSHRAALRNVKSDYRFRSIMRADADEQPSQNTNPN